MLPSHPLYFLCLPFSVSTTISIPYFFVYMPLTAYILLRVIVVKVRKFHWDKLRKRGWFQILITVNLKTHWCTSLFREKVLWTSIANCIWNSWLYLMDQFWWECDLFGDYFCIFIILLFIYWSCQIQKWT